MGDADTYANDYPIDLEHRMVSGRLIDPTNSDTDAMAWHRLEVRKEAGGLGLWAVRVSWTPEGARRLRARSQRYTSPAFYTETDPETGRERVVEYINCALCARPATHEIPPLVASARTHLDTRTHPCDASVRMASKDRVAMAAALASLDAGDAVGAQSALRAAVAAPEDEAQAPADGDPPAEPEDEEYTRARAELFALAGDGVSDVPSALRVLSKRAREATGAADLGAAAGFMSTVLRERSEREATELRALVTELVSLKAETPATAWANGAPVARLLSEGLPSLRTRVAALRKLSSATATDPLQPPASLAGLGVESLQDFERADADNIKDPVKRERFIATRIAKKQKALNPNG